MNIERAPRDISKAPHHFHPETTPSLTSSSIFKKPSKTAVFAEDVASNISISGLTHSRDIAIL